MAAETRHPILMARPTADPLAELTQSDGRLAENITHFARALRKPACLSAPNASSMPSAPSKPPVHRAPRLLSHPAGVFRIAPEHLELYAQTFALYWRDPQFLERMMHMMSPLLRSDAPREKPKAAEKRAAEALLADPPPQEQQAEAEEITIDAELSFSADEKLKAMDFEQMSLAELADAKRAIARIQLPIQPIASRRTAPNPRGNKPDWRATLRQSLRQGGDINTLARRQRRTRFPNLVALCDISGSMAGYSRMLLHFLHAASHEKGAGWAQVHSFTFGTRLTNITRQMRLRDVDDALREAGAEAGDWEGGTRIGAALHEFNHIWSRRVLGQGAVVLLITDGLEPGQRRRSGPRG